MYYPTALFSLKYMESSELKKLSSSSMVFITHLTTGEPLVLLGSTCRMKVRWDREGCPDRFPSHLASELLENKIKEETSLYLTFIMEQMTPEKEASIFRQMNFPMLNQSEVFLSTHMRDCGVPESGPASNRNKEDMASWPPHHTVSSMRGPVICCCACFLGRNKIGIASFKNSGFAEIQMIWVQF